MHAAFYFRACHILNHSLYNIYYTRVFVLQRIRSRSEISDEDNVILKKVKKLRKRPVTPDNVPSAAATPATPVFSPVVVTGATQSIHAVVSSVS